MTLNFFFNFKPIPNWAFCIYLVRPLLAFKSPHLCGVDWKLAEGVIQFKEQPFAIYCFTMQMFHGMIILGVPLEEDLLGLGLGCPVYLLFGAVYLIDWFFCLPDWRVPRKAMLIKLRPLIPLYWSRQLRLFWVLCIIFWCSIMKIFSLKENKNLTAWVWCLLKTCQVFFSEVFHQIPTVFSSSLQCLCPGVPFTWINFNPTMDK